MSLALPRTHRTRLRRLLGTDPSFIIGATLVLTFCLLAIFAEPLSALSGNDPYAEHLEVLGAGSGRVE